MSNWRTVATLFLFTHLLSTNGHRGDNIGTAAANRKNNLRWPFCGPLRQSRSHQGSRARATVDGHGRNQMRMYESVLSSIRCSPLAGERPTELPLAAILPGDLVTPFPRHSPPTLRAQNVADGFLESDASHFPLDLVVVVVVSWFELWIVSSLFKKKEKKNRPATGYGESNQRGPSV